MSGRSPRPEYRRATGSSSSLQQRLPFANADSEEDSIPELTSHASHTKPRPAQRLGRSHSTSTGYNLSSSYGQSIPTRSFFHNVSHGTTEPLQYSSQGVREQTEELASWALGDSGSYTSERSRQPHTLSDSGLSHRPTVESLLSDSEQGQAGSSIDSSLPEVIEEVSEPATPQLLATYKEDGRESPLPQLSYKPPPTQRKDRTSISRSEGPGDGSQQPIISVEDVDEEAMNETSPLLPKARPSAEQIKPPFEELSDAEQQYLHGKGALAKARYFTSRTLHTLRNPKQWDHRAVWRHAVVEPVRAVPAVFLGLLLNILDALSYGTILFPLGESIFENTAADGVSIFYVSCIVSQLTFSLGGSIFKGGVGSEMIEVVPFFHKMAYTALKQIGKDNPAAVLATVITSYALSSVLTGVIFLLLGFFRLGNLVSFFPRNILTGCIGGVGVFLFLTGIEVSAGINGNLDYNLSTLERLLKGDTLPLWVVPLVLAILLIVAKSYYTHPAVVPVYFISILAIFYFFVAVVPTLTLPGLRDSGWIFQLPEAGVPFYHFYSYYNFKLVDWEVILKTIPTMFALSFFGIIHVPINVPALGLAVQEDDVNTNRELIAHGISNTLSGLVGSIQNYLVYANSQMFIRNGGNSRMAGILLAIATTAVWFAGPTMIGFIPKMIVGTLIYLLGIELIAEALWDTLGKTQKLEYFVILAIVLVMGLYDFVVGIVLGIVLACLIFVIQTSRVSSIRATYTGSLVESTVRRHPIQRRFLHAVGSQISVVKLAGYLFFGSIVAVENKVRHSIEEDAFQRHPIRYLILDFLHVSGLDFSAAEAFVRMHRILRRRDVEMILSGISMSGEVGKSLSMVGLFDEHEDEEDVQPPRVFWDLNEALEACENELLLAFKHRSETMSKQGRSVPVSMAVPTMSRPTLDSTLRFGSPRRSHIQQAAINTLSEQDVFTPSKYQHFAQPLPLILQSFQDLTNKDFEFWHKATSYFERKQFPAGHILYSRGDEPDGFFLLEQGILRADYELEQGSYYESIVAGTTCGELPFFSETDRTGTVVAEKDCVAWLLTKDKWRELEDKLPEQARELLKIGLKLTSERMNTITSYLVVTAT